jgi:hypothetical protein
MYLRTTKRQNKDGSIVEYYQLAETRWDPTQRRPTAHIIYNFGRADALDREALLRLARSISRVCQGGQALLSPEDRAGLLERLARDALSADDRHVLGQLIQVTQGSQPFLDHLVQPAPQDAPEKPKRTRTLVKRSRRRQRRSGGERQGGPRGVAARTQRC